MPWWYFAWSALRDVPSACSSKAARVISSLEPGGGACCGRRWAPGRQGQVGAPATCVTHRGSSSGSLCMKAPCMSLHCVTWSGVTLRDGTLRRNAANRSSLGQKRKIVLNDDAGARRGASHPLLCKEHRGPNVGKSPQSFFSKTLGPLCSLHRRG